MCRSAWWAPRGARMAIAWAVVFAAHAAAAADEIPSVNLGPSGPDRELPVGKSFYVAGTARPTVQLIQAAVVRKGSPVIGGGSGPSCPALRTELGRFRAAASAAPATTPAIAPSGAPDSLDAGFALLDPGRRSADAIWERGDDDALITGAWQRGELKDAQPFKLLVSGDPDFFRPGYSYCLFVFTQDHVQINVEPKVRAAFDSHLAAFRHCGTAAPPPADPGDAEAQRRACEQRATDALVDALKATGAGDPSALANAASVLETSPAALRYLLESWRSATDPTAPAALSFVRRVDLAALVPLDGGDPDAPLAGYIASLLARRDGLFAQVAGGGLAYRTIDGKTAVNLLGFRDDGKLDGSTDATAATTVPLPVKLDELAIPNTSITARDLIEATQGRIRLAAPGPAISLKAAEAELAPALAAGYGAPADRLKPVAELRLRVEGLAEAVRRGLAASAGFRCASRSYPKDPALAATPEQRLGEWLRCRPVVLDSCPALTQDWDRAGVAAPPCDPRYTPEAESPGGSSATNPRAWPGYRHVGANPLDAIAGIAADLLDAHQAWRDAILVAQAVKVTEVRSEARIGFTQETWIGSYLTPSLGYAYVPFAGTTLLYAAVQFHVVPNPVDDPQWSHHGHDWPRAFALEIGFAPDAGSFGPDGRLDGPWSLPPVFFGLAFHPIPYVSLTGGFTLDDLRTTTLVGQRREVDAFGFVAVTLQANLPDLLYRKLGYGLKTTADK